MPIINNKKQVLFFVFFKNKYNQPHKHLRDREPTYILCCLERWTSYPDNQRRMPVCLHALWVFAIYSGGFSNFTESCWVAVRPFGSRFTMLQVKQPEVRAGKPRDWGGFWLWNVLIFRPDNSSRVALNHFYVCLLRPCPTLIRCSDKTLGRSNSEGKGLSPLTGHGSHTGHACTAAWSREARPEPGGKSWCRPCGNTASWLHLCGLLNCFSYTTQGHLARGDIAHNKNRQGPRVHQLEAVHQLSPTSRRLCQADKPWGAQVAFSDIKALEHYKQVHFLYVTDIPNDVYGGVGLR